jgi:hypothetical protein
MGRAWPVARGPWPVAGGLDTTGEWAWAGAMPQVMYVTAVTGDGNVLMVARGANGTAPAAHANGAAVAVLTDYSVNPVPTCSLVRRSSICPWLPTLAACMEAPHAWLPTPSRGSACMEASSGGAPS